MHTPINIPTLSKYIYGRLPAQIQVYFALYIAWIDIWENGVGVDYIYAMSELPNVATKHDNTSVWHHI